jgi:hypothetical protein
VLERRLPILRAKRDELDEDDPSDSGWQFLCDSGAGEGEATIRVVSIEEIVMLDPTVSRLLDNEVESAWVRLSPTEPWVKETIS